MSQGAPRTCRCIETKLKGDFRPKTVASGSTTHLECCSGVVLKAWGVKVVVAVCSGGSSSSGGLLRGRPSASPGVMRGVVEGGGAGAGRDGPPGSPPGASGALGAAGSASRAPGAARAAAGEVPAPRPRFAPIAHLAWWDGVSHAVTHPGSRDRHLTREHVTLADVLAG